ncbi:DUF929 family protein [Actinopolymorpha alba]|uniref:DUF929 family protein n=1 Tax=Actinopolymorpha alba TaxID=533267 RepID=UPI00036897B9|nr:DUF929 family protein [Actinopolymorpha alba]
MAPSKPRGEGPRPGRERLAAMRAAQQRKERRRRLLIGAGAIAAVIIIMGAIIATAVLRSGGPASQATSTSVPAGVLRAVTRVPSGTLESVGRGSAVTLPKPAKGQALSQAGKPEVLYVGAEYCPYCAAQRWPMVVALSRFGSFSGLRATHSASEDVYPNTPTFTFHGATYTSSYLSFVGKELTTNQRKGTGYAPLDTLTSTERKEFDRLTGGTGSIPLVDFAGRYVISGVQYDPSVLTGKTMNDIAQALGHPSSPVAKGINGSANTLTAAICQVTKGQPASVCATPAIKTLRAQLTAGR